MLLNCAKGFVTAQEPFVNLEGLVSLQSILMYTWSSDCTKLNGCYRLWFISKGKLRELSACRGVMVCVLGNETNVSNLFSLMAVEITVMLSRVDFDNRVCHR